MLACVATVSVGCTFPNYGFVNAEQNGGFGGGGSLGGGGSGGGITAGESNQGGAGTAGVVGTGGVSGGGKGDGTPATCQDGLQNGSESDVDCGGGNCKLCEPLATCTSGQQCTSNLCSDGFCDAGLRISYYTQIKDTGNTRLRPELVIKNVGSGNVALPRLSIRYYFTVNDEGTPPVNVFENSATMSGVTGGGITTRTVWKVVSIPPVLKADAYLEISFTADVGALPPGEHITLLQSIVLQGTQTMTQTNDFSFDPAALPEDEYRKIPVYIAGELVYGESPE
jgi:hypothetical protein